MAKQGRRGRNPFLPPPPPPPPPPPRRHPHTPRHSAPTTPQEPTTVGRGENPPVNTPSATPTPALTTDRKKKEEDCPQRGKGCVALEIGRASCRERV